MFVGKRYVHIDRKHTVHSDIHGLLTTCRQQMYRQVSSYRIIIKVAYERPLPRSSQ